jgi:hypothetical protein
MLAVVKRTLWLLAVSTAIVFVALALGYPRSEAPAHDHHSHGASVLGPATTTSTRGIARRCSGAASGARSR